MPKVDERIQALEAKLKQLKTQQQLARDASVAGPPRAGGRHRAGWLRLVLPVGAGFDRDGFGGRVELSEGGVYSAMRSVAFIAGRG
jgi:hypothetical protein